MPILYEMGKTLKNSALFREVFRFETYTFKVAQLQTLPKASLPHLLYGVKAVS